MRASFHCIQRPLFTNEPSFSIQCVVGTMNTSVWIDFGSTPGRRQNSELVGGRGSITASHRRLASACITWLASGPMLVAVIPDRMTPSIFFFSAWWGVEIQVVFEKG